MSQLAFEPGKKGWFSKTPATLQIGAKQAEIIGKLAQGRILKDKKLSLVGSNVRVVFEPGKRVAGLQRMEMLPWFWTIGPRVNFQADCRRRSAPSSFLACREFGLKS